MIIKVFCDECGDSLSARHDTENYNLMVLPCETCLKKSYSAGFDFSENLSNEENQMIDIDILNTSWKTEVTPEQSAEIQRLLFKFGKVWSGGDDWVQLINEKFLCFDGSVLTYSNFEYKSEYYKIITADDIITALRKLEEQENEQIKKINNDYFRDICKAERERNNRRLTQDIEAKCEYCHEIVPDGRLHDCGGNKGEKTVSEETNEDEWISFYEEMPQINKEIELKFYRGHTPEKINATLKVLAMWTHGYFGFVYHDGNEEKELTLVPVESWRPIKEKRPDFGKLREGDLIIVEWKYEKNNGINISAGFIYAINYYIEISTWKKGHDKNHIIKDCIKKITRIDLETREFEEI